ncbi:Uncharacterised protein [Klebsiella pneumoniae]|nr:Uncharacterised protein [Klebsiella pneumoniae]
MRLVKRFKQFFLLLSIDTDPGVNNPQQYIVIGACFQFDNNSTFLCKFNGITQ